MCIEAYLQGQDLWELVTGADAGIPTDIPEHAELRRKWKIKCSKTLFALRTSISKEFIDHVRDVSSPKEVWDTLEKLCIKRIQQEALAKQMAKNFESDAVLFSKGKPNKKNIDKEEWIIDSGCSHHVTGNDTLFSEMRQHHGERVIVTANNSTYPVAKEVVVTIDIADDTRTSSVKLNDVYHVPGLKKNLVSVSQIIDFGKYVLFGPNDVKVLDNVKDISADVILTGEKKASLFVCQQVKPM
ncbi:hypothetical protein Patl1_34294 [Pistacia atlantica]|uniref:Uncharacterized protein n=1 Tax=Pistacia atlantica TaxID=434234 RepID=A0ACC0ZSA2_9ROSI|nr:hypothetical protein Patl1_34294 [Pistacia atlantica]